MKFIISSLLLLTAYNCYSQCENNLGYDKTGKLASIHHITLYEKVNDTTAKGYLSASLAKTEITNGVILTGIIDHKLGKIDESTKMRITFQDNTYLIFPQYHGADNSMGMFLCVITDKYSLLLLKTKPIAKIDFAGNSLPESSYVSGMSAVDFLLDMDCLESYL